MGPVNVFQVSAKRTNVPGMKQFRPRRFMGYAFMRPYVPPYFYSPYGYGWVFYCLVCFFVRIFSAVAIPMVFCLSDMILLNMQEISQVQKAYAIQAILMILLLSW